MWYPSRKVIDLDQAWEAQHCNMRQFHLSRIHGRNQGMRPTLLDVRIYFTWEIACEVYGKYTLLR